MKFAALNKEASAERATRPEPGGRKATREAQESGCLQRYHEAIRLQQAGETEKARALYCEILESKVMDEAEGTMLKLKFLTFKNLGSIARGRGDDSAALDAFIQAVDVDGSEVTVWYQMALAASALGNLLLARTALDEARKCHTHYWPAVDLQCTVLLALDDVTACLQLIDEVLPHLPDFPRGLAYLHHLAGSSPECLTFMPRLRLHLMKPCPPESEKLIEEAKQLTRRRGLLSQVEVLEEPIKPPKALTYYSLFCLGQSLVSLYRHCCFLPSPSMASPVDLQLLCEGTNQRPLLPNLVTQAPPTSSEEVSGEESGELERKRKILDLPQPVLPKRRSSRVKSKREQVSASERFARFLPDRLRGCEFGDVCALSPLPSSGESPLPSLPDQSDCSVVNQPRLAGDVVKTFLQDHQSNSGIISLIFSYLLLLAQHYNWHWSEVSFSVVKVYMELYELVQPHLILPSPLCSPNDPEYLSLQHMAMISLCYSELKLDYLQRCSSSSISLSSLSQSLSFSQMSCGHTGWRGSHEFSLRVNWCMYKKKQLEVERRGALAALRECQSLLERENCHVQVLPNLRHDPCISPVQVSRKMRDLEQMLASQEVYALFQSGDHSSVVVCLRPMLDWTSDNFSQFLLGESEGKRGGDHKEQSPLSMLLLSLLSLKRWQECVLCCLAALQELLISYKLGNEKWVSALHTTYTHLARCLEEAPGNLLQECGESIQRHLVVCVFRTLELQVEMADSPLFHLMPLSLPWTALYFTLLSLWEGGDVAMETSTEPKTDVAMETEGDEHVPVAVETETESPAPTANQEVAVAGTRWGLQFLCEVHDHLGGGGQGWCVGDKGQLLKLLVSRLREELRLLTAHPPKTRETLLRELEQCYYCLYGHPHKKAKAWGLQDHGAEQLPLTWESAQVLLEFYHPSFLPAVEENKALTPELVSLYLRLVDIIPDTGKVIPLSVIAGYIEGKLETLPLPSPPAPHTTLVSEIFYLLADDALKSGDYPSALHNYTQSVCYCPERVDTWAGLALARARTVMKKLDRRDVRSGMEAVLQKQVTPILRSFKRALALGSQHHYITEKYGLFCYTVQSYCSQIFSVPHLYSGKTELMLWAERSRRGLLKLARQCFCSALSKVGGARAWVYGLVAAKAGVKLGKAPADTLPLLTSVAKQLSSDDVIPPVTVELRGPWMTAVEIHYQIFSCALKYLTQDGGVGKSEAAVAKAMGDLEGLPLSQVEYPGVREWVVGVLRGGGTRPDGDKVSLLVQKVIADAEREVALETGKPVEPLRMTSDLRPEATPTSLLERCIYGVAVVSVRCPAYYKSLYKLASIFHSLGHSQEARKLLLGPLPEPLLKAQDKLQPLFVLKSNIFANFWQIPVDEINRPGRFSSSARASLQLLCDLLSQQKDSSSLLLLVQYLRNRPDSSRQYLRDYERVAMCQKAIQCCSSVHQQILREIDSFSNERLKSMLLEIHSLRTHCLRSDSRLLPVTKTVESVLVQCYHVYQTHHPDNKGGVAPAKGGVASGVEEAVRYCQSVLRQQTDKPNSQ